MVGGGCGIVHVVQTACSRSFLESEIEDRSAHRCYPVMLFLPVLHVVLVEARIINTYY